MSTPDPNFISGFLTKGIVNSFTFDIPNRFLMIGTASNSAFTNREGAVSYFNGLCRTDDLGVVDENFLVNSTLGIGKGFNGAVYSVVFHQYNGHDYYVVGGDFTQFTDQNNNVYNVTGICRLNSDGSMDTSFLTQNGFNSGARVRTIFVDTVTVSPNVLYVIGGKFSSYTNSTATYLANSLCRLNPDNAAFDTLFQNGSSANNGFNSTCDIYTIILDTGKYVAGVAGMTSYSHNGF